MKPIVISFLMIITLFIPASAQKKTLFNSSDFTLGGYFSPVVKFSSVHDDLGLYVGARGGLILNHTFAIGLGGYGLVTQVEAKNRGPFGERYMEMGYGGVDIEYIISPNELVHFSVSTLIGGGGVLFNERTWHDSYWNHHQRNVDAFFVIEPAVNVDLNVTTFLKTSLGMSYRVVSGLNSDVSTSSALSGPTAMLSFRVGKF